MKQNIQPNAATLKNSCIMQNFLQNQCLICMVFVHSNFCNFIEVELSLKLSYTKVINSSPLTCNSKAALGNSTGS